MNALKDRMGALEKALDEKDRELREVSINRADLIQRLNTLQEILKADHQKSISSIDTEHKIDKTKSKGSELPKTEHGKGIVGKSAKGSSGKLKKQGDMNFADKFELLASLEPLESDKTALKGKYSYRDRMILMNRIDIYRLFITVIIISSEIKYPRKLTKTEERELKMFINELSEFENLILNINADEDILWEKGKTCEKQILQLFTQFFKV